MTAHRKASCSESQCPSSFELIPPADFDYRYPIVRKPSDEDYLKRVYECEKNIHKNVVYWIIEPYREIVTKTINISY